MKGRYFIPQITNIDVGNNDEIMVHVPPDETLPPESIDNDTDLVEILNTLVMTDGDDDDDDDDISRDTPLIPEGIDVEDDDLIDM